MVSALTATGRLETATMPPSKRSTTPHETWRRSVHRTYAQHLVDITDDRSDDDVAESGRSSVTACCASRPPTATETAASCMDDAQITEAENAVRAGCGPNTTEPPNAGNAWQYKLIAAETARVRLAANTPRI